MDNRIEKLISDRAELIFYYKTKEVKFKEHQDNARKVIFDKATTPEDRKRVLKEFRKVENEWEKDAHEILKEVVERDTEIFKILGYFE